MVSVRSSLFILLILLISFPVIYAQDLSPRATGCRFEKPRNITIDCYYLSVPENRESDNSRMISLAIAIIRHPSTRIQPDPIIFLQGGPGGSTLDNLNLTYDNRFEPLLLRANRDIIVFDQRGTGRSNPSLDCVPYQSLQINLLDFELDNQHLSRAEIHEALNQALLDCGHALANSHDLGGYVTRENAADIDAIRQAFGYEQVNLWGISYGTKLALTAMRDYPDSFRRVVLDSTYPLESNLYIELPTNFDRALNVLFDACEQDTGCNQTYPDLENVLLETVNTLNQQPIRFDAPNPYINESFEDVIFDGTLFLRSTFQLFYATDILPRLPQLIYDANQGYLDVWQVLVGWLIAQRDSFALGMNFAVQCQEEFAFTEQGSIGEAWSQYVLFDEYRQSINMTSDLTPICEEFVARPAPEAENLPVQSTIPTLIIAGEYDPITPPQWGEQVAREMTNSLFLEIPSHGHGATGDEGCAQYLLVNFFHLNDVANLNTSCLDEIEMVFSGVQRGDFNAPDSASAYLNTMMP